MEEAKKYVPGLGSLFFVSPDEIDLKALLEQLNIDPSAGPVAITINQITDASAVGKNVLSAADAAAARAAIGAGTSNLTLGTTASTALAGNGTAAMATRLATGRMFYLSGAVTGSASFDGTGNPTITTTLAAASTSVVGGVKQSATQAASTASDVAGLVTDFNALLTKLKAAGIMA